MADTRFKTFLIDGFDFGTLSGPERERFAASIVAAAYDARWWTDPDGLRFSLLKCDPQPGFVVSGVLAQQHALQRHLYDDKKRESTQEIDSYEDRFFVIELLTGRVTIEWRQFRNKPPLTLTLTESRFARILTDILGGIRNRLELRLVPYTEETPKSAFVALFYENRVLALEVTNFGSEPVPEDVVLVNPNPHLEGAQRELIAHDFIRNSIDKLAAEARADEDADLRRAAFVRSALHSGQPNKLVYQKPNGEIRVRRQSENGVVSVSVPVTDTDSASDRGLITAAVMAALSGVDLPTRPTPPQQVSLPFANNYDLFDDPML